VDNLPRRTAVIIGASSGIGEALAHELNRDGWQLGLLARRCDRLDVLRHRLAPGTVVRGLDVAQGDAAALLEQVIEELGGVDLVIISAGTGHNNRELHGELDIDTVNVNVIGFMAVAQAAMRHFLGRGRGHLVGFVDCGAAW
jgi:short-subunit dehydrogenase